MKCASGVSDKVVIPHWAKIFSSQTYAMYSLAEWSALPDEHFVAMYQECSCWMKNNMFLKNMFRELAKTKTTPLTLEGIMAFPEFGLKSTTLILQTYLNKPIVVCVDCHLQRTFKKFNWVHHDSSSADESAIQVSLWLDITEFININNVITGIQQLLQSKKTRKW